MKSSFHVLMMVSAMHLFASAQVQLPSSVMVNIPSGKYRPFYKRKGEIEVKVKSFYIDVYAVTNEQFLQFVRANPKWARSKVSPMFADTNYLKQWGGDFSLGVDSERIKKSPVTNLSWFAANAYCKWVGKRLPTQDEWEYMAGAERSNKPFGDTMSLNTYILKWYEKPMPYPLPSVGSTYKNKYGVWDAHGLIWEWVFDFNTALTGNDSRSDAQLDRNFSCAAGAGSTINKTDYASYMRNAFRQSLKANYSVGNLGFRCAKNGK